MRVAVAGGTGMVGSRLVTALRERGDEVVVLSRSEGVDLTTGEGLEAALAGVDVVVDVTSTYTNKHAEYVRFFGTVAERLQRAGAAAGVRRVVTLSIVGIDGLEGIAHYAGKLAQEKATEAGEVPTTILRASQFHDFAGQLIGWIAKGPLMPCPVQPVRTVELAAVVEQLALATRPDVERRVRIDLVGPREDMLHRQIRATAGARGRRLLVVPLPLPGAAWKKVRAGALQGGPDALVEGVDFDTWLAREH